MKHISYIYKGKRLFFNDNLFEKHYSELLIFSEVVDFLKLKFLEYLVKGKIEIVELKIKKVFLNKWDFSFKLYSGESDYGKRFKICPGEIDLFLKKFGMRYIPNLQLLNGKSLTAYLSKYEEVFTLWAVSI